MLGNYAHIVQLHEPSFDLGHDGKLQDVWHTTFDKRRREVKVGPVSMEIESEGLCGDRPVVLGYPKREVIRMLTRLQR